MYSADAYDDRVPISAAQRSATKKTFVQQLTTSRKWMRVMLILGSVVFMLVALVVIGVGGWAAATPSMRMFSSGGPAGVIVTGVILLALSAIGFWTAYTGNRLLIMINGILLACVCVVFIFLSIGIFIVGGKIHTDFYVDDMAANYHSFVRRSPYDACQLERHLQCSGFSDETSLGFAPMAACWVYYDATAPSGHAPNFTALCPEYRANNSACFCPAACSVDAADSPATHYQIGCYERARDDLRKHFTAVAAVSLAFDVLLALGCLFNWCLCCRDRRGRRRYYDVSAA